MHPGCRKACDGKLTPMQASSFIEGQIEMEKENFEGAKKSFETALSIDPNNPFLLTYLALAIEGMGKREEALRLLEETLKNFPDYEQVLLTYAEILIRNGETAKCEEVLKKVIELYPDSTHGYVNLFNLYLSEGKIKKAYEISESLILHRPDFAESYEFSARTSFLLGMYQKFRQRIGEFINKVPLEEKRDRFRVLLDYGKNMFKAGKLSYALFCVREYRKIYPADIDGVFLEVMLLSRLGKIQEARGIAKSVRSSNVLVQSQLLYESSAYDEAGRVLENEIDFKSLSGQDPSAKLIMAVSYAGRLDFPSVVSILKSFNHGEENFEVEAFEKAILIFLSSGMEEEAMDLILNYPSGGKTIEKFEIMNALTILLSRKEFLNKKKSFIEKFSNNIAGEILLRWGKFLEGDNEARNWWDKNAEKLLEEVSLKGGEIEETILTIIGLLTGEKVIPSIPTDLLDISIKIEKKNPDNPVLPLLRGRFYFMIGSFDTSLKWFNKSKITSPFLYLWRAEVFLKQGNVEEAKNQIQYGLKSNSGAYLKKRFLSLL